MSDEIEKSLNERLDLEMSGSTEDVRHGEKKNRLEGYSFEEAAEVTKEIADYVAERAEKITYYKDHNMDSSVKTECSSLYEDMRVLIDATSKLIEEAQNE